MLYGTQDRDFFPRNFVDRLNYIKELGYDCYEVDGKELVEKTAEIKDAVEKTKVPVTTACNGYRGWIGDFIEERSRIGYPYVILHPHYNTGKDVYPFRYYFPKNKLNYFLLKISLFF